MNKEIIKEDQKTIDMVEWSKKLKIYDKVQKISQLLFFIFIVLLLSLNFSDYYNITDCEDIGRLILTYFPIGIMFFCFIMISIRAFYCLKCPYCNNTFKFIKKETIYCECCGNPIRELNPNKGVSGNGVPPSQN